MKNLILILVIAVTFSNFASSLFSLEQKRGLLLGRADPMLGRYVPKGITSTLDKRQGDTCPAGFDPCSDGVGCCPTGAECLPDNKCGVDCTAADVPCPTGGCCPPGSSCDPAGG